MLNPGIDFIYNAQIYRDNIFNLYQILWIISVVSSNALYFTYNGIYTPSPYDYLSKAYYDRVS